MEEARKLLESGEFPEATKRLHEYLHEWGGTTSAAEAEYLLAESMEGEVRENPKATVGQITDVSGQYRKAERLGYDPDPVGRGLVRIANLLRERGFYREADALYRDQLISQRGYWQGQMELAQSLQLEAMAGKELTTNMASPGVDLRNLTPQERDKADLEDGVGVMVVRVTPEKGLSKAGLKRGDIICRLDNVAFGDPVAVAAEIRNKIPGRNVAVTYLRDGEFFTVNAAFQKDPDQASALFEESRWQLKKYLGKAEGRDRIEALYLLTDLYWIQGKYPGMEKAALVAIPDVLDTPDLARFYLQWGKAKSRQNQIPEALERVLIARDMALTAKTREEATYFEIELRLGQLDGRGEALVEKMSKIKSPRTPLVQILLGKYRLETGGRNPFSLLKSGLEGISDMRDVAYYKPDLDHLWELLKEKAETEEDLGRFHTLLGLLEEYHRIFPARIEYQLATAKLKRARGGKMAREAASMERADPIGAEELRREAGRLYYSAGTTYAGIVEYPEVSLEVSEDAQKAAAEAFFAGGQYAKAARWFRSHYHVRPLANRDSLFKEGKALMHAKLYEADSIEDPSALRSFAEFSMEAGPLDSRTHQGIVFRGQMLMELGRPLAAISILTPLIRESQYEIDPSDKNGSWRDALLLLGMAHLQVAEEPGTTDTRKRDSRRAARRSLDEYMERFSRGLGPDGVPPGGALKAGFALSRIATEEKQWNQATDHLLQMLQHSTLVSSQERLAHESTIRRAHFLLGDLYLNQGNREAALRAYDRASRKYATSEDRLWGLVGRARTLIRMGNEAEAQKAVQAAKSAYESHPELYDESMDGRGKLYWPAALQELEAELQEGITLNAR